MEQFNGNLLKLNVYYSYNLIDPHNYWVPNKTVIDNIYWNLNSKIFKIADLLVHKTTLQDFDSYWLASRDTNHSFYTIPVDSMRQLERLQISSTPIFLQWNIRRSNLNKVQARTYRKITDILTDLGGFTKTLMFLAAFLAIGYVRYKYTMIIATEIYDFEFPEVQKPKENQDKQENTTTKKFFATSLYSMEFNDTKTFPVSPKSFVSPREEDLTNKYVRKYAEKLKSRERRFEVSEWAYLKELLFFWKKDNYEKQLATKARDLALNELDIVHIVRKLQEFDRIKYFLLNKQQIDAFVFMEKPLVTIQSKKPLHSDSYTASIRASHKTYSNWQSQEKLVDVRKIQATSLETIANFEEESTFANYNSLPKYGKLFIAYKYLKEDTDPANEVYNRKLIGMLNPELVKVFKKVNQLVDEDVTPKQFEYLIKNILDNNYNQSLTSK